MICAFKPRCAESERRRVRIAPPTTPKPINIIAQVVGSGTGVGVAVSMLMPSISENGG